MATIIKVNLDLLLVQRKMTLTELSEEVGITLVNSQARKRPGNPLLHANSIM